MSVHALVLEARRHFPDVVVDEAMLEERLAGAPAGTEAIHPDIVLAVAAEALDPRALAHLERLLVACARQTTFPSLAPDDLVSEARDRLLGLGEGGRTAKLRSYKGTGPLAGWLRVVVARVAVTMARKETRGGLHRANEDALARLPGDASLSPELVALRQRYEESFREAFRRALAELPLEDRNLLRLHLLDGLGIDELAPSLGVHRATAARRIGKAKRVVLERTRALMREASSVSDSEFDSLVGVLASHVQGGASALGSEFGR